MLAFTIAAEIGEIERFALPEKLTGYSGLCPRVNQGKSGRLDSNRRPLGPSRVRLSADRDAAGCRTRLSIRVKIG